jgi:two-component system CheB/CheR fusion protein
VIQVDGDTPVEADHVYCIPPGKYLSISRRSLRVTTPSQNHSLRMPINFFLRSLAAAPRGQVIGIILSGTGTDGTIGLREVKAAGGLAIAQDPATAEHGGMPRSAIDSGAVDHVLSPERMPDILIDCVRHLRAHDASDLAGSVQVEPNAVNELLESLHGRTTLDLRSYKRSTLERRIARRMGLKQLDRVADYARLLIDDPVEAAALTNDLLISVTSFFRDPEAWRFLQERVLRPLVAGAGAGAALRVWVPGCATGEEAYSIAMVLTEEVEAAGKSIPMQIFASDLDVGALEFARTGLYPESIVADVPPERLRRFFVQEAHAFRVTKRLRESVLFARQNLIADPPFPTLDLICCRNVLMYFESGTHKHLLSLLHFALVENGHLFLGTA